MRFEEYRWLFALLLIFLPLLRWRSEAASRFSSLSVLSPDRLSKTMLFVKKAALCAAFAAVVVGLANPVSDGRMVTRFGSGASIVFVLDMSTSMEGEFTGRKETKWKLSEDVIERFVLRRCPKDRIALIGFGSMPITFSNFTSACRTFSKVLKSRGDDLGGTVIGWPLQNAVTMLRQEGGGSAKAIVLVSDGDGSLTNKDDLVRWFRQYDIRFYWINISNSSDSTFRLSDFVSGLGPVYAERFNIGTAGELERAFKKIDSLERGMIRYQEWQPSVSYRRYAFMTALAASAVSILLAMFDFRLSRVMQLRRRKRGEK